MAENNDIESNPNDDEQAETTNLDLPDGMFRMGAKDPEKFSFEMWKKDKDAGFTTKVLKEAFFSEIDGEAFFEGDIYLGKADEVRQQMEELAITPESKGIGISGAKFRWKWGEFPFVVENNDALRHKVKLAIKHWETYTPIKFIERTFVNSDQYSDYVSFENRGRCASSVGRQGGKQIISIGSGCTVGSTIHEIGHALGLFHEQSRSDRDEHIEIIPENINPRAKHNFDKHIQDADDLGDYDYKSIMHYPPTAFGNGSVTIRTKNGESIGQRNGLSRGDIQSIKLMYPELDWDDVTPVP